MGLLVSLTEKRRGPFGSWDGLVFCGRSRNRGRGVKDSGTGAEMRAVLQDR